MARPRSFDAEEVLDAAMMTFWRNGFEATTTRMLEEATGVGLRSLFNAFGDKEAIFEKVLTRYLAMVQARVDGIFATPGLPAIRALFESFLGDTPPDSIRHSGCLVVNTVFEVDKTNPRVRAMIESYRAMWRNAFETSLRADNLPNIQDRADYLVGVLWGGLALIRLAGDDKAAAPVARGALETLSGWG